MTEFITQSMAGSIPLLYGIVSGHTVFKLDIVKPKYTRLLLMAVYLGGTMSGILVRYMIWDPVQQFPNLVLASFEACLVCEWFNILCTRRKLGRREWNFLGALGASLVVRMIAFSSTTFHSTDGISSIKAMMDARPWLPSIDCALIKKGEPDIVGPGVCAAILLQTFMSIFLVVCCDDIGMTRSILGATRMTKLLLLTAGAAQYARDKVSYYHCSALSNLIILLTIPDLNDFRYPALKIDNQKWYWDSQSLLAIMTSGLHLVLLVPLVLLGFPLWTQDEWCLGVIPPNSFAQPVDRISNWKGARLFMANYIIVFEVLLIINTIREPRPTSMQGSQIPMIEGFHGSSQPNSAYHFDLIEKVEILLRGWALAGVLAVSTHFTVTWLYELSEQDESQWSFGQVAALASVIISLSFQTGDFLLSPSPKTRNVPRYKHGILKVVSALRLSHGELKKKIKSLSPKIAQDWKFWKKQPAVPRSTEQPVVLQVITTLPLQRPEPSAQSPDPSEREPRKAFKRSRTMNTLV